MKLSNLWYTWVTIEAGPGVAKQWKYSVKVSSETSGAHCEIASTVVPIDWKVEQVIDSGHYLTLTAGQVKNLSEMTEYVNNDGNDNKESVILGFSFTVTKPSNG